VVDNGAGFSVVWPQFLVTAIIILVLGAALLRFRKVSA
jgi:hypothetical protein